MVIKQKNSIWEGNQSLHLFIYLAVAGWLRHAGTFIAAHELLAAARGI